MTLNGIIRDYRTTEAEKLAQIRPPTPTEVVTPENSPQTTANNAGSPEITAGQDDSEENSVNDGEPVTKRMDDLLSDEDQENDPQDQLND